MSTSRSPLLSNAMIQQLKRIECVVKHCGEDSLKRTTELLMKVMLGGTLSPKEMKSLKTLLLDEAFASCSAKHCGTLKKIMMRELNAAKKILPKTKQGEEVAQMMEESVMLRLRVSGHTVPKRRSRSRSKSKRLTQRSRSRRR